MTIIQRKEMGEQQPAIDTVCDHCGAIYDLVDCTILQSGTVLCPDCAFENELKNEGSPNQYKLGILETVEV
jgi:hypothetical protein